jgi:hypothetical protein
LLEDIEMAKEIIRRNGNTSEHSAFTGAEAEITVDTDKNTVVVHDGATTGGFPLAKDNGSNVSDFTITGILGADSAEFTGTGAVELPEGTEAQRPGTPAAGMIRFNSDADAFEGYNGSDWGEIGGGAANGLFHKSDRDKVAWTKTGNDTAETSQTIYVEVDGEVLEIASGTTIAMPSLSAGTDYAIWVAPDGTLEADTSFATAPTAGGRRIGGFHYAPGGNASFSLDAGDGGTTPQINEFSFHDLKWKPSVADPRGLTLVGDGAFWCGIYHLAGDHLVGPPHRHGVNPARDGNPPDLVDGSGKYPDAQPMNIFESLWYHGFRTPRVEDFQLLAFGTNEAASRGSDPGTTGLPGGSTDAQFTSHWGVIQSTGVIRLWSNDSILSSTDETLPNPSRGNRFRVQRFAILGGNWTDGSASGSRYVVARTATDSSTSVGGRGVCDHVILD